MKNHTLEIPPPDTLREFLDHPNQASNGTCYLCIGPLPDCSLGAYFGEPSDLLEPRCSFWMKCTHIGSIHAACFAKYVREDYPRTQACPLCGDTDHEAGDGTNFLWAAEEDNAVDELY